MAESKITSDEFNETLAGILQDVTANTLLDIPGIYEILAEEYNNEVIEKWEETQGEVE